ncbi:MAG: amidohydrolase family protein [Verrucomicrobiota bacterium]
MLLRARIVVPVSTPPIENGGVVLSGDRITAVGRWDELRVDHAGGPVVDLGEAVLAPGWINAHCHLDYTGFAGRIPPRKSFPDWIKQILALKAHWSYTDYAASWVAGAQMLVRSGTTTVADIEAAPELLPDIWASTPLRMLSLLELTVVRTGRPAQAVLDEAVQVLATLPPGRKSGGFSPHAPYSTTPELLRLTAEQALASGCRMAIHVAESHEEFEMFMHRTGSLHDWLKRQRNMSDCGLGSPVMHLARQGALSPFTLAVHANYLAPGDAALLASSGTGVAHCPRSHAYFQHQPFPLEELRQAGVNLCIGTDSLASMITHQKQLPTLDMFAELRTLAQAQPGLSPEFIVRMATLHGARALGLAGQAGELTPNAHADMLVIPGAGSPDSVYESIVHHQGPVQKVMIGGQWVEMHGSKINDYMPEI